MWAKQGYDALHAAPVALTEQDRLIIGLLRLERLLDMRGRARGPE